MTVGGQGKNMEAGRIAAGGGEAARHEAKTDEAALQGVEGR